MSCAQIINHEVERSIACDDLVIQHQNQVRTAAHFIDRHLGSVEYRAHADRAYKPRRFLHPISL